MTSPRHSSLKQRALHALKWSFLGYGISQAIRLGTNLVMTRLLVPDMFGVMAIAGMITIILGMLSDIGLRQSIVQNRRGEEPAFLDTAWVVQIMRGAGLWVVAILVSIALYLANRAGMVPAQSVYASPLLPLVIAVSSLSAFISGFQSTKMATAQRSFDQKRINVIALVSQCAGLLVMIPFGALSPSVWVLVAGGLMVSLTTTVLSHTWMEGQPNHFRLEKKALRELIEFGKWVFASSALFILVNSGDRLLLGAFVDADVLGLYSIAVLSLPGCARSTTSYDFRRTSYCSRWPVFFSRLHRR
jgi:O-antigen/teichoic acid export membrane protein